MLQVTLCQVNVAVRVDAADVDDSASKPGDAFPASGLLSANLSPHCVSLHRAHCHL